MRLAQHRLQRKFSHVKVNVRARHLAISGAIIICIRDLTVILAQMTIFHL
jgi:hypothetical protein